MEARITGLNLDTFNNVNGTKKEKKKFRHPPTQDTLLITSNKLNSFQKINKHHICIVIFNFHDGEINSQRDAEGIYKLSDLLAWRRTLCN